MPRALAGAGQQTRGIRQLGPARKHQVDVAPLQRDAADQAPVGAVEPVADQPRRCVELLDRIESTALTVREKRRPAVVMEIDASVPDIVLPFERPLYRVPTNRVRASAAVDDTRRTDASGRSTR